MQTLLNNIELDVQELKYLINVISHEADTPLREVAKRSVLQMRARLDILLEEIDNKTEGEIDSPCNVAKESEAVAAPSHSESVAISGHNERTLVDKMLESAPKTYKEAEVADQLSSISSETVTLLAEQVRLKGGLLQQMSLNDSFRFSRELFHDSAEYMKKVLQHIETMKSFSDALTYLSSELDADLDSDAWNDFTEFLKKNFE